MSRPPNQTMSTAELVAMISMLFSCVAFSVDAILPAIPQIEQELGGEGFGYFVISFFMAGLAMGTLLAGPISDAVGRKPVVYFGAIIYIGAGFVAWQADSFDVIIAARFAQGIGAAGPRVISIAIVRDLYSGAQMARIVSFAMVLFTVVPTLAPAFGAALSEYFGWRSVLLAYVVFMSIAVIWLSVRLSESLPPEARRPLKGASIWSATKEIFGHSVVLPATLVQGITMGLIFSLLVQVQPIYEQVFDRGETFPYWFGGIALVSAASTSIANAFLVIRFGMHRLVTLGLTGHIFATGAAVVAIQAHPEYGFAAFAVWQFIVIWLTGLCVGNLNAIMLEPLGHVAGLTTSLTGGVSTLLAAGIAGYVGSIFDGTPIPLLLSILAMSGLGLILMLRVNSQARKLADSEAKPISPTY